MVIYEMGLKRVIEQLDKKGIHSFSTGIYEEDGSYARKVCQYLYYDKEEQIILLTRSDITFYYKQQETLRQKAETDILTGIYNNAVKNKIRSELSERKAPAAIMFMDLDNFKLVNDQLGHKTGDELLCKIASTLKENMRNNDLCGRIGGDEFVLFLNEGISKENRTKIVGRIQQSINRTIKQIVGDLDVTCSIGVAMYPEHGRRLEVLLEHADVAVYKAKEEGKNKIVFYKEEEDNKEDK